MNKFLLILKGMAMGGADVIPGVSGGTMALITGIYEELIEAINEIDGDALKLLLKLDLKSFWKKIHGPFLLLVFGGVLISIFSLAKVITYLLEHQAITLWSFFFGLILISAFYVLPAQRNSKTYIFLATGALLAYMVTSLSPAETPTDWWFVMLSGAIAICAMILPGISGSFILLLLGKYEYVLASVKDFDLQVLAVFGVGCAIGILSFSKLIHWLLNHHKEATLALLAGFMLGSLNKIWPWKLEEDERFVNLSPFQYTDTTGEPNELLFAILCFIFGVVIVIAMEQFGRKFS